MSTPNGPRIQTGDGSHRLHDVDLVAAYAGEDPGIDRDLAAELVQTCPECRAEFELQRDVAGWMSASPAVVMSDEERSMLHRRVDEALARPNVVSLSDRRSRRPGQILLRLGTAAAALAVIAGIGGVFNTAGDNGGDTAFQTIAAEQDEAESSAGAAPTTTTMAAFAAASAERAVLAGGNGETVKKEIEDLIAQSAVTAEATGAPADAQADSTLATPACSDQVEGRTVMQTAESSLDGEPIIIFLVTRDEAAGDPAVEALVFEIASCAPVSLD